MESFQVSLSAEEDPAILLGHSSVVVEIDDDDHVTVGMVKESYTVAEEGGTVEVCIRLTGAIETAVSVTMGTEGTSATGKCEYNNYDNLALIMLQSYIKNKKYRSYNFYFCVTSR